MTADERPVCALCHRPAEYRVVTIIRPLACQRHLGLTVRVLTENDDVVVERVS